MRLVITTAALLALGASAAAQEDGLITCWYNSAGAYTGSDSAQPGAEVGVVVNTGSNDDYAYSYTIQAPNGKSCPRSLPK